MRERGRGGGREEQKGLRIEIEEGIEREKIWKMRESFILNYFLIW